MYYAIKSMYASQQLEGHDGSDIHAGPLLTETTRRGVRNGGIDRERGHPDPLGMSVNLHPVTVEQ